MITWYYIKNWFKKSKKSPIKPMNADNIRPIVLRKKRDNNSLTTDQITLIRKLYVMREQYGVKTYAEFTKFCNDELEISKSRSVYHRIINKEGRYSVKEV